MCIYRNQTLLSNVIQPKTNGHSLMWCPLYVQNFDKKYYEPTKIHSLVVLVNFSFYAYQSFFDILISDNEMIQYIYRVVAASNLIFDFFQLL